MWNQPMIICIFDIIWFFMMPENEQQMIINNMADFISTVVETQFV
jgi:hypothetical protein